LRLFVGVLDKGQRVFSGLLVDCHSAFVVATVMRVVGVVGADRDDRLVIVVVVDGDGSGRTRRGTETFANLTLNAINGRKVVVMVVFVVVFVVVLVDVDVDVKSILAVRRSWAGWSTGTAVTLFLTYITDLFFFPTRRWHDGKGRRVLTFPSGLELGAVEIERELRVLMSSGGCIARLGLAFPVG
jgi:hypothetical protein